MNTEITINRIVDLQSALTQDLKRELAAQLSITAKTLKYLAAIWHELASRGVDLSDLKSGLATYLPRIANNSLEADLVVKYAGQKVLLDQLSKLPIKTQREFATTGTVQIVKLDKDLNRVDEDVSLAALTAVKTNLVFRQGRVLSPGEQYKILFLNATKGEQLRKDRKVKAKIRSAHRVECVDDDIYVGTSKTSIERVLVALSARYGFDVSKRLKDEG